MAHLGRSLDVPDKFLLPWANGVMERLWHFAAMYTPCGDIGKIPDEAIARACMWPESESQVFIDALVGAGWLQKSEAFRLVIHDWSEHCEDSVHTKVCRRRMVFFDGTKPKLTGLRKDEKETLAAFYHLTPPQPVATPPQPVATPPQPVATPPRIILNGHTKDTTGFDQFRLSALEFWTDLVPEDLERTWMFWKTFSTADRLEVVKILRARIAAGEQSHYVTRPPKYLENGAWKRPPRKPPVEVDKNQKRRDEANQVAKFLRAK